MTSVCLYFHVHQPFRLSRYGIFDIAEHSQYFDDGLNEMVCRRAAVKCYLPTNAILEELLQRHPNFKVAFSISGVMLEQLEQWCPEVIESFRRLVATGRVELVAETYYHSLASQFDPEEFRSQVRLHVEAIQRHFGVTPTTFRNTELIYSDEVGTLVAKLGFRTLITEGADQVLGSRLPTHVYRAPGRRKFNLLLKHYRLSDDIAFRFSGGESSQRLTADTFAAWVHATPGDTVNLFMDYETFGEHQWEETGIFDFLRALPAAIERNPDFSFATPAEVTRRHAAVDSLSVPIPISWADLERDLSAWLGNPMQDTTAAWVYRLGAQIRASGDPALLHTWRKLQTSDHFYYMCTKHWADGDVHEYFSIYDAPHEAYVYLNNVLADLELRLNNLPSSKRSALDTVRPSRQGAISAHQVHTRASKRPGVTSAKKS